MHYFLKTSLTAIYFKSLDTECTVRTVCRLHLPQVNHSPLQCLLEFIRNCDCTLLTCCDCLYRYVQYLGCCLIWYLRVISVCVCVCVHVCLFFMCRLFDHSMEGFKNWEFMTTHCWGEKAAGDWVLEIYDSPSQLRSQKVPGMRELQMSLIKLDF